MISPKISSPSHQITPLALMLSLLEQKRIKKLTKLPLLIRQSHDVIKKAEKAKPKKWNQKKIILVISGISLGCTFFYLTCRSSQNKELKVTSPSKVPNAEIIDQPSLHISPEKKIDQRTDSGLQKQPLSPFNSVPVSIFPVREASPVEPAPPIPNNTKMSPPKQSTKPKPEPKRDWNRYFNKT